jgi:hypothetical protein
MTDANDTGREGSWTLSGDGRLVPPGAAKAELHWTGTTASLQMPAGTEKFYLLVCRECGNGDLVMPFGSPAERGKWASGHTKGTGHDRWFVTETDRRLTSEEVAEMMARNDEVLRTLTVDGAQMQFAKLPPPVIVIEAEDRTELLRISRTEDGRLDASGPEDRWTEGAARFVAEVRRMLADD